MRAVLSAAGSDCSGGAGIQADLKTITACGMYGMTVITALTAQNTQGIFSVRAVDGRMLSEQFDAVFTDICPDAVKLGMLPGEMAVRITAEKLSRYGHGPVVLDPVMVSTSGRRLMNEAAAETAKERLFPLASLITPNLPEAEALLGIWGKAGERTDREIEEMARELGERFHTGILIKGGHRRERADDCLYADGEIIWFRGERIFSKNSHGTGCTLSSAIACGLSMGWPMEKAVSAGKRFLTEALRTEPGLGHGNGPLNHCFGIREMGGIE